MAKSLGKLVKFLFLTAVLVMNAGHAQSGIVAGDTTIRTRKVIEALRIESAPKIDGYLDELFWQNLPVARDFTEYAPVNGIKPPFRTEVRFGFDDIAFYASAVMYDPHPDSICREMGKRDQIELLNTDYISFDILPYNDALNMYEFKISPIGLQNDTKYSALGQDVNWDAVWESAARITDSAWIVEVKIPFSALRFSTAEKQVWGINMWRNLKRRNEWSTWCYVDNTVQDDLFKYYGEVAGMQNVDPPLRLSVTPYIAGYVEKNPSRQQWSSLARGGMDLRLGINESYTVDMMVIPDFGQVQSDDRVLNLSPFEIRYDEKRQFFTESTEMFEKCGIFYSRRVGSTPRNFNSAYDQAEQDETVKMNPDQARIVNATKISGRNANGLGAGLFNAMTANTWATLENTETGSTRKVLTQPFTNYNVLVLDQNLRNKSYVSLINTNYYSPKDSYAANVTGVESRLSNKKSTFVFFGKLNVSNKIQKGLKTATGHAMEIDISKPNGKFQYYLVRAQADKVYDPNDMGFLLNNNYASNILHLYHMVMRPRGIMINTITRFSTTYNTLFEASKLKCLTFEAANKTTYSNYWVTHFVLSASPLGFHDYYEPRLWGFMYHKPAYYSFNAIITTDSRKPFYVKSVTEFTITPGNHSQGWEAELIPRIRFNDKVTLTLDVDFNMLKNDFGWVNTLYDTIGKPMIFFGRRTVETLNSVLSGQYTFSTKTAVTLRLRHYWSQVDYDSFFLLNGNGDLESSDYQGEHDINFNAFTADAQFVWYFAPGSELSFVWKNAINTFDETMIRNYFDNLEKTFSTPQTNSFSVRILYYLDYQYIRKLIK
ncbi:MAG TPA: DUF5916 domain-containing protein [Bacteroidales bacterium]|nr:DUF5916 domain-containing protein [Bacteroidales bacterium]HPT02100.1 DUF5916 domain-containing protein [Bacteroidales bacterium]